MARNFSAAGSDNANFGTGINPVDLATSMSIAGIIRAADLSAQYKVISEWDSGLDNSFLVSLPTDGKLFLAVRDESNNNNRIIQGLNVGLSAAVEYQFLITYSQPNTFVAYINGTAVATANVATTGVTSSINSSPRNLRVGIADDGNPFNGYIAEVAIWKNVVLDAAQAKALGNHYSPLFFRRGLTFYAPIMGKISPEPDLIVGGQGTLSGTTAQAHPRMIYPN